MSDEATQVSRDVDLQKKSSEIHSLENLFKKDPSIKLAENILNNFEELLKMPKGCYKTPNISKIEEKMKDYKMYLEYHEGK